MLKVSTVGSGPKFHSPELWLYLDTNLNFNIQTEKFTPTATPKHSMPLDTVTELATCITG